MVARTLTQRLKTMIDPKQSFTGVPNSERGKGGELHQTAATSEDRMTTNSGMPISDNQNALRIGDRGPLLLEDFVLREKITHFDHERIPERVVHARGYAAHGFFEPYPGNEALTKASFLQTEAGPTEVFCRFSTVAGSEGSPDTARDVRGFAVKFYTNEGNYDLVGNNMPVFFIQDAMKFPDLIHSVKPEPDRGFPQAQSAHNTFWDFVSLNPESMHVLMWVMSDRGIPRSFRMMDGFGIHTFQLINSAGKTTFVKFHWKPKLGAISLIWDEAVTIAGADPDFHRRDLWNSINKGDFPEWDFCVQAFSAEESEAFPFDVLDPTKLIPEELVPLQRLGRMVLNRNVDNFFAETEQVAFCVSHLVPGIGFSNDPLLHGRSFSYLDTQLSRLGSSNFQQIPVNKPKCPYGNFTRDGHMQMQIPKGNVAYEPNTLDRGSPRECPGTGFKTIQSEESGKKLRIRPESFSDHYSQASMFFRSMQEFEQRHIIGAIAFELGKCSKVAIRLRMLGHLDNIDKRLAKGVAKALGNQEQYESIAHLKRSRDMPESPALSQYGTFSKGLAGKKFGVLLSDGSSTAFLKQLSAVVSQEKATLSIIAPNASPITLDDGAQATPDDFLAGAPSALFDSIIIGLPESMANALETEAAATNWIRTAFAHLKAIGYSSDSRPLVARSLGENIDADGVINIDKKLTDFISASKEHRFWAREPALRRF